MNICENYPLYNCGFVDGLSQNLEIAIVRTGYKSSCQNPNVLASSMARNVASSLLAAKVLSVKGRPLREMKSQYLLQISRYFSAKELARLENNPEKFVSEFSLNPCQRGNITSFVCYLFDKIEPYHAGFQLEQNIFNQMEPSFEMFERLTQHEVDGTIVSKSPFEIVSVAYLEEVLA
jgi:hypothetical protein